MLSCSFQGDNAIVEGKPPDPRTPEEDAQRIAAARAAEIRRDQQSLIGFAQQEFRFAREPPTHDAAQTDDEAPLVPAGQPDPPTADEDETIANLQQQMDLEDGEQLPPATYYCKTISDMMQHLPEIGYTKELRTAIDAFMMESVSKLSSGVAYDKPMQDKFLELRDALQPFVAGDEEKGTRKQDQASSSADVVVLDAIPRSGGGVKRQRVAVKSRPACSARYADALFGEFAE